MDMNRSDNNTINTTNNTLVFSVDDANEDEMRVILKHVYNALKERGYNPLNQLVGYITTGDRTFITTHNNARSLIRKIDRDELLRALVKEYLED